VNLQPALGVAVIRTDSFNQPPEARRVILLLQMHQFVKQDVIAYRRRHLQQPVVERNPPRSRAGAPARPLVANAETGDPQLMLVGQGVQPEAKLLPCRQSQICLDVWTEVPRVWRNPDGTIPIPRRPSGAIIAHANRDQLAPEHQSGAIGPLGSAMRFTHAGTLASDPVGVFVEKSRRFGPRAAAGDRDPDAAVGAHANDVAPSPPHPHEIDLVRRPRRRWLWRLEKRQFRLHGALRVMIPQRPCATSDSYISKRP
jgi:hypothetical protein